MCICSISNTASFDPTGLICFLKWCVWYRSDSQTDLTQVGKTLQQNGGGCLQAQKLLDKEDRFKIKFKGTELKESQIQLTVMRRNKHLKNINANGSVHMLGYVLWFPLCSHPPRALPYQKIKWIKCTQKFFSVPSWALAHFVCNLRALQGLPIPGCNVVTTSWLSRKQSDSAYCMQWSSILPRRKLVWTAYFCWVSVQSSQQDIHQE